VHLYIKTIGYVVCAGFQVLPIKQENQQPAVMPFPHRFPHITPGW